MQWDLHLLLPGLRTFPALFKKYSITWNWSQYNMLTENSSSDVNVFCSEFLNCKIPSVMFQFRFYLSCYSVNIQTGKNSSGSIFKNKKFVLLMSVYFVENVNFLLCCSCEDFCYNVFRQIYKLVKFLRFKLVLLISVYFVENFELWISSCAVPEAWNCTDLNPSLIAPG